MNDLQIFSNAEFGEIRTIKEDGKVLFCGSDVAKALGYKNTRKALSDHCKGVTKRYIGVQTGKKADGTPAMRDIEMNFVTEGDIYRLAAKSELPGAERFESWIFDEVLPSIRQNGGYIYGQETLSDDELMAKAFMIAQNKIAERDKRIASLEVTNSALTVDNQIMKPKADYFDELVDRNLLTNFRETAKQLGIKEKDFIGFLLSKKYIYRDQKGKLQPYAPYVKKGLFELKECYNEKTTWSGTQALITPKGRETFRLLYIAG